MRHFLYNDQVFTGKQLAEFTGVSYTTLMERIKRGYTVEEAVESAQKIPESIQAFTEASDYHDWAGLVNSELYKIYRDWCARNDQEPESSVHFTRCIKRIYPNIRIVPTRLNRYGEISYKRVIRVDSYD